MAEDVESALKKGLRWEQVPPSVRHAVGNSADAWKLHMKAYCIRNQLRYDATIAQSLMDQNEYYESMINVMRDNLLVYPYHLSDVFIRQMKITPFDYYIDMLAQVLKSERSYDSIPNFTATDAFRLTGVGRNEAIHILTRFRGGKTSSFSSSLSSALTGTGGGGGGGSGGSGSGGGGGGMSSSSSSGGGGWLQKLRKNAIRDFLPSIASNEDPKPWWRVSWGVVGNEEMKKGGEKQLAILHRLQTETSFYAGEEDRELLLAMNAKKLIYFDVPVAETDTITLPPLQGFVMNRVVGDAFERLLYQVFVSLHERTTVQELSQTLETDISLVRNALSFYCRLGLAKKKNPPTANADGVKWHSSWQNFADAEVEEAGEGEGDANPAPDVKNRIGVFFDATLTAFLMMGNLSPGLKDIAVTMFEVGKLCDESVVVLEKELENVNEMSNADGDAQRYFDHAVALRTTIRYLKTSGGEGVTRNVELLRCESINALDANVRRRLLSSSYSILIAFAPLSTETLRISSSLPPHFGPPIPEVVSPWFKLFVWAVGGATPAAIVLPAGTRLTRLPRILNEYATALVTNWDSLESSSVAVHHLLLVLNESLLNGPVLVQGATPKRLPPLSSFAPPPSSSSQPPPSSPPPSSSSAEFSPPPLSPEVEKNNNNKYFGEGDAIDDEENDAGDEQSGAIERQDYHVAFPLSSSPDAAEDPLEQLPPIQRLVEELGLNTCCGFITLARYAPQRTPLTHPGWEIVDVQFGIPLFDHELNRKICQRIDERRLFSEENIRNHTLNASRISLRLLNFISSLRTSPVQPDLQNSHAAFPTGSVCVFQGELSVHPAVDTLY